MHKKNTENQDIWREGEEVKWKFRIIYLIYKDKIHNSGCTRHMLHLG
jgi:hypothetical protein